MAMYTGQVVTITKIKKTSKAAQKQLEARFYVATSPIHGKGLYARRALAEGEYLGEYDGPTVTENGMHVLWVEEDDGQWVGRDGKNLLRYLNHSKRPSAEFVGFELFALRDIEADEEVTIDYGEEP